MFKAKLIEDLSYYRIKRKELLLTLLISIPAAAISSFATQCTAVIVGLIIVYIGLGSWLIYLQKKMKSKTNHRTIEIDADQIHLISSKQKEAKRTIQLKNIDKILLKEEYNPPLDISEDYYRDMINELRGNQIKNFIILEKDDRQQQYDFIVDSHYMLKQLGKIISNWKRKGFVIENV
ncbi:MAG: hypothetical protein AAGG75_14060 [Bacteroidota bacterium]